MSRPRRRSPRSRASGRRPRTPPAQSAMRRVPKGVARDLAGGAREVDVRPAPPPLEDAHGATGLGQPAGGYATAEPRADHDDVVRRSHTFLPPLPTADRGTTRVPAAPRDVDRRTSTAGRKPRDSS